MGAGVRAKTRAPRVWACGAKLRTPLLSPHHFKCLLSMPASVSKRERGAGRSVHLPAVLARPSPLLWSTLRRPVPLHSAAGGMSSIRQSSFSSKKYSGLYYWDATGRRSMWNESMMSGLCECVRGLPLAVLSYSVSV
jgi:hypothetical protein